MNGSHALPVAGLVLIALATSTSALAGPGSVTEDAVLHEGPTAASVTGERVAAGTAVERLQRQAGWVEVRLDSNGDGRGWIRVWQFRPADAGHVVADGEHESDTGALGALRRFSRAATGLFGRDAAPTARGDVTATIGVRGLGLGEIEDADADPDARRWMDGHRADADDARRFARAAGLRQRSVPDLHAAESAPPPAGDPTPPETMQRR